MRPSIHFHFFCIGLFAITTLSHHTSAFTSDPCSFIGQISTLSNLTEGAREKQIAHITTLAKKMNAGSFVDEWSHPRKEFAKVSADAFRTLKAELESGKVNFGKQGDGISQALKDSLSQVDMSSLEKEPQAVFLFMERAISRYAASLGGHPLVDTPAIERPIRSEMALRLFEMNPQLFAAYATTLANPASFPSNPNISRYAGLIRDIAKNPSRVASAIKTREVNEIGNEGVYLLAGTFGTVLAGIFGSGLYAATQDDQDAKTDFNAKEDFKLTKNPTPSGPQSPDLKRAFDFPYSATDNP